jgi:23S rRNA pseudouridine1911/1915/1917 synthase
MQNSSRQNSSGQNSSQIGSSLEQGSNGGQRLEVTVAGDEGSNRLDRTLAVRLPELSRSRLKALILAGSVAIKGAPVRDPAYHVAAGDTITIDVPEAVAAEPAGEDIALDIVYEDADIIVIDKPKGLVVHPAAGHETGTLVNALIAHCGASLSGIGGVKRPGIVHRLDKDTTGLMVVAKNDRAHQSLTAQFADHGRTGAMRRGYRAFVWGVPNRQRGTVEAPIDRHPHAREKMAVRDGGREAVTHWEVQETFQARDGKPVASLLACQLETGRTHQIRVHLAHIGHPLMGDAVYGPHFKTKASHLGPGSRTALADLGRQALHAYRLVLEHPRTGEVVEWISDLPKDLIHLQNNLRATQ